MVTPLNSTAILADYLTPTLSQTSILGISWIISLVIIVLTLLTITRDYDKWKRLLLPVAIMWDIVGLNIGIVIYLISVFIWVIDVFSVAGIEKGIFTLGKPTREQKLQKEAEMAIEEKSIFKKAESKRKFIEQGLGKSRREKKQLKKLLAEEEKKNRHIGKLSSLTKIAKGSLGTLSKKETKKVDIIKQKHLKKKFGKTPNANIEGIPVLGNNFLYTQTTTTAKKEAKKGKTKLKQAKIKQKAIKEASKNMYKNIATKELKKYGDKQRSKLIKKQKEQELKKFKERLKKYMKGEL